MSVWFYLSDWFTDVPTLSTLVRRCLALIAICAVLMLECVALEVPAEYAAILQPLTIVAGIILIKRYNQQRRSR
jgi:hypothetical protein